LHTGENVALDEGGGENVALVKNLIPIQEDALNTRTVVQFSKYRECFTT